MLPYTVFLVSGLVYYVLLSAVAAGGPGLRWGTAWPIIAALVMGGFAPGLTLLRLRVGYILAAGMAVVVVGYIISIVSRDPAEAFALVAALPALVVILLSIRRLWKPRQGTGFTPSRRRWWVLLPAAAPALPAAWLILEIFIRLPGP